MWLLNYRTTPPLSTFPFISILPKETLRNGGKRFVKKVLDTGKKVDPLRCANPRIPKKLGSRTAPLREALFYLSPKELFAQLAGMVCEIIKLKR